MKGHDIAIVVSRFNDFITEKLLEACLNQLVLYGIKKESVSVIWVPGALELPVVALQLARKKSIKVVICLGAVIRGETYHFEVVAQNAARGISEVALRTGKPCIFGVLTTDTVDQAYRRSKKRGVNKGRDAADAAVEMINILAMLQRKKK